MEAEGIQLTVGKVEILGGSHLKVEEGETVAPVGQVGMGC